MMCHISSWSQTRQQANRIHLEKKCKTINLKQISVKYPAQTVFITVFLDGGP
jgi:hypothetical protein